MPCSRTSNYTLPRAPQSSAASRCDLAYAILTYCGGSGLTGGTYVVRSHLHDSFLTLTWRTETVRPGASGAAALSAGTEGSVVL